MKRNRHLTSRQDWVEWTLREWWFVKLCAAFAAFFGVLRVSRSEVAEKILAGKKFGLFKPHTMKWKEELRGELVDSVAYVSGSLFTRSLRKYGEEN